MKRSGFKRPERPPREPIVHKPIPEEMRCRISDGAARLSIPLPKPPEPLRSEKYRRLVASFPCCVCGRPGPNQAAHPSTGRGMAQKTDDRKCFSLCPPRVGEPGCHAKWDQGAMHSKEQRRELERRFMRATVLRVLRENRWPSGLPLPSEDLWREEVEA